MRLSTSDSKIMGLLSLFCHCVYMRYPTVPYSGISALPEARPPWAWQARPLVRLSCLVTFPWSLSLNTPHSCRPPLWFGFCSYHIALEQSAFVSVSPARLTAQNKSHSFLIFKAHLFLPETLGLGESLWNQWINHWDHIICSYVYCILT